MFSEPDGTGKTVPTNQPILLEDARGEQPSHSRPPRESPPLRKLSAIPWSPQVLSVIPAEVLESLNVILQQ
ncbi:hypothetical protein GIB19_09050 [Pseudomonas sp. ITEM 17296]|uniref:hypothetical protein n=1 Tax=Pseudomonas sp. ITEM 17296 TaxID=2790281 RepID=UPI00238065D4|nr:hypothetical protein [Pseudomonas sp. ITEM 17296]MDE4537361.1 hypothetical protein [Pseudomonas sp. ITEM 17296]